MEDSFYDIGYEGTSLEDCLVVRKLGTRNVIVFDKNDGYGTTFDSFDSLKNCCYVKNLKVNKQAGNIKVEAIPYIFRPDDEKLTDLIASGIENFVDFIPIPNHYFILNTGKYYKIPYSKTELVDLKYCNFKERHLLNKLLRKEITLKDLKKGLSEKTKRVLFNGIIGDAEDYEAAIRRYLSNFGNIPFLYPKHGLKDLSEMLSRSNAMCGISFLLNKNLKIYNLQSSGSKIEKNNTCKDSTSTCKKDDVLQIKTKSECDLRKVIKESAVSTEKGKNENTPEETIINDLKYVGECKCETEHDSLHIKGFDDTSSNYEESTDEEVSEDDVQSDENDHTGQLFIKQYKNCACLKSKENYLASNRDECVWESNEKNKEYVEEASMSSDKINIPIENLCLKELSEQECEDSLRKEGMFNAKNDQEIEEQNTELIKTHGSSISYLDEKTSKGYKYLIKSDYGNVFVKELTSRKTNKKKIYVRLLNTTEKLIGGVFFAFLHNGKSFIRVIGIDSSANSCPDGTYNIYLIKKNLPVSDDDLNILKVHQCKILLDVSYETYGEWSDYLT